MDFYAVFIESSYHVPGDERSRTNPGHGYPAHDVSYTEVVQFGTLDELKAWVVQNDQGYGRKKFKAVKCSPLSVSAEVVVKVS